MMNTLSSAAVGCDGIAELMQRTLNRVDPRLVDHGKRVARLAAGMLDVRGCAPGERRDLLLLAMLHDIGAYKTEEIDRMLQFETQNIWGHSVYGYLFIRDLSPLAEYAPAVLFHHLDYQKLRWLDTPCGEYAQIFNLADRADIFLENRPGAPRKELYRRLRGASGTRFDPLVVELFLEADARLDLCGTWGEPVDVRSLLGELDLCREQLDTYLRMLIYTIDFRSSHTVAHTLTTTALSWQLGRRMGLSGEDLEDIVYGAMLHDLGKMGIPVEILEFPGKLSPQAMGVMRTHVDITEEIIGGLVGERVARIALRHHEKLDGSGYPRGLTGEELTLPQRIVAVADIVSALCGTRSYKAAFPKEKTLAIIGGMAGEGLIDRDAVMVMCGGYDEIMKTVMEETGPVRAAYRRIQEDYARLMKELPGL